MTSLDENAFERIAGETLDGLFDALEGALDDALGERADVDMQQGILTIDVQGSGHWVINKNAVARQIWLSSPVSGGAHFDWDGAGEWVGSRGEGTLRSRLEQELSALAGVSLDLS